MLKFKPQQIKIDKTLFLLTLGLSSFGILMIYNASSAMAIDKFNDGLYFARLQFFWSVIGIIVMFLTSKIDYHLWRKVSFLLLAVSIIALILVLIPGLGREVLGGKRWLSLGGIRFQPGELAKLTLILYLTTFFEKEIKTTQFVSLISVLSLLLMLEPDLGTTVILLSSAFIVYFLSGAKVFQMLLILIFGFLSGLVFIWISPYRMARVRVFLNPNLDPQGISYHLRQILLALGSGGLWGRGIGQSRQKFLFLPEAATDSIFAVIGEEMGFIGACFILGLIFYFILRGLKIAQSAPDKFGQVLAGGITGLFFVQSFLNLGAMVSLLPLTGVPLPFLSYGGSFLVIAFWGVGILLNISRFKIERKK